MPEKQSKPMKEISYRESRVAKLLGDPAKYAIASLLLKKGPTCVTEIARMVHRRESTVSYHLSKLKGIEIVRYEAKTDGVYYWIKYPQELSLIIKALKTFVKRSLAGLENDI